MKGLFRELAITAGLALVIFLILQTTIQSSIVEGSSMLPGLENNQRLIVVKAVYHFRDPQRGDIIIIHPPVAPDKQWVKRVIGLPGDTVEVKNHTVYVNNVALKEPYIKEAPNYTYGPFQVPAGQYFVLGDNRANSDDSHIFGTVPMANIIGKAWLTIWPLDRWGIVGNFGLPAQVGSSISPAQ